MFCNHVFLLISSVIRFLCSENTDDKQDQIYINYDYINVINSTKKEITLRTDRNFPK